MISIRRWIALAPFLLLAARFAAAAETDSAPTCLRPVEDSFTNELWAKVAAQFCLNCHKAGGDAEDSQFVLRDPQKSQGPEREQAMRHNQDVFLRIARLKDGDESRVLLKVAGK